MVYLYSTITVKLLYAPGTINIIPFNTFHYYSIIAAFPIISIVAAFAYIFNIAALHYCVLYPTGLIQSFITDRSKVVVLLWFSVACFGVRVSVTFHLTCVHIR